MGYSPSTLTDDMRSGFNWGLYALESWGMGYLPITRTGFGVLGMEGYSFWAMALILVYGYQMKSPVMLLGYFPLWLLMVIVKKIRADPIAHSSYQGWPFLTGWLFGNEYHARCAEAALLLPLGALLGKVDEPLGLFVAGGVLPLLGKYIFEHTLHLRRVRVAMDMQAEAAQWNMAVKEAARRQRWGR